MPVPASAAFADVSELSRGLAAREYSSVELTKFFLERCQRFGASLNAIASLLEDEALAAAAKCDAERGAGKPCGPLHGIPYGAKDLFAHPSRPTTWGAPPYRDRVIDNEAGVLKKLSESGAVLIAKLSMVEIAGGMGYTSANASLTGPGRNPWKTDRWSGGSSSGCGSAVAAGLTPFAIGSETWGSITSPAGNCGVTGLRPTYEAVTREGAMTLSWTMDKVGPFARTAADVGTILAAIASGPLAPVKEAKRPVVATIKGGLDKVQPEIAANFNAAIEVLREFCTIEELSLPDLPYNAVADMIIACEAAAAHEELVRSGDIANLQAFDDQWRVYPDLMIPAVDYLRALRVRTVIQREFGQILPKVDAIASPTLATVSCPCDLKFSDWGKGFSTTQISAASNLAGVPAITVFNGFAADHLPSGLQFVGNPRCESLLVDLASKYQSRTKWHREQPSEFAF